MTYSSARVAPVCALEMCTDRVIRRIVALAALNFRCTAAHHHSAGCPAGTQRIF